MGKDNDMPLNESGTVSERHEQAHNDVEKVTAGQLAAAMRRKGYAVTAKELKEHAPEWHHAGWTPRGNMGKCYFFPASAMQCDAYQHKLMELVEESRAELNRPRFGFKAGFRSEGTGRRKRHVPIVNVRELQPNQAMGRYMEITEELYRKLLPHNGADLEPWESPEHAAERLSINTKGTT